MGKQNQQNNWIMCCWYSLCHRSPPSSKTIKVFVHPDYTNRFILLCSNGNQILLLCSSFMSLQGEANWILYLVFRGFSKIVDNQQTSFFTCTTSPVGNQSLNTENYWLKKPVECIKCDVNSGETWLSSWMNTIRGRWVHRPFKNTYWHNIYVFERHNL